MKKKNVLAAFIVSTLICLGICVIAISHEDAKIDEQLIDAKIPKVDIDQFKSSIFGSTYPRVLAAQNDDVIIEVMGKVFLYDLSISKLVDSFDLHQFGLEMMNADNNSNEFNDLMVGSFVSSDAEHLYFSYQGQDQFYRYSFSERILYSITSDEHLNARNDIFDVLYFEYDDDLYSESTGSGVVMSDGSITYISTTLSASKIDIVNLKDETKKTYSLYSN